MKHQNRKFLQQAHWFSHCSRQLRSQPSQSASRHPSRRQQSLCCWHSFCLWNNSLIIQSYFCYSEELLCTCRTIQNYLTHHYISAKTKIMDLCNSKLISDSIKTLVFIGLSRTGWCEAVWWEESLLFVFFPQKLFKF